MRIVPQGGPELAYLDLGTIPDGADTQFASIWPPDLSTGPGRVWISDDVLELRSGHRDRWELEEGQLVAATPREGIAVLAYWYRVLADGTMRASPHILFRSLREATDWAGSLTEWVVIQLTATEPRGVYRLVDGPSTLPTAPEDLVRSWDDRYSK